MRTLLLAAVLALAAAPVAAQARITLPAPPIQPPLGLDVGADRRHDSQWDDDDRWSRRASVELVPERRGGWYSPGQSPRMELRTTGTAYVAAVHIDTQGRVEILYPASPWGRGEVHGRRSIRLAPSTRRGGSGMGYVFAVASEYPLDFSDFAEWRGRGWRRDAYVWGDPYRAMRRITRALVGDLNDVADLDQAGYRVGQGSRYPGWACATRGGWDDRRGWDDRGCDRVRARLRREPDYYDGSYYGRYNDGRRDGGRTHSGIEQRRGSILRADDGDEGGVDFGSRPEPRAKREPGHRQDVEREEQVERARDRTRPRVVAPVARPRTEGEEVEPAAPRPLRP